MKTRIKSLHWVALLVVAGLLAYYPILGNQLLDFWDDQWVVMNFYTEGRWEMDNLWRILTEYYHGQYAPFNELFYLSLYSIDGYNPIIFHLGSLLLHLSNACLVFYVMRKLLFMSKRVPGDRIDFIAFLTALIFVLHPFNVEAVAWMSASKVLVYAFFYLWATYFFLLFLDRRRAGYLALTFLLYLFSFLGKEQAITFPLQLLLMMWLLNYKWSSEKELWLTTLPFFLAALIFGIITIFSQMVSGGGALSSEAQYTLWQRGVYACYSFVEYWLKCLFPFKLSYLYPFPTVVGQSLPGWLLVYPLLLVVALVSLKKVVSKWPVAFALLFFTIHIMVALHIIPMSRFAVVADRYAYISSIAASFLIAYYFVELYILATPLKRRCLFGVLVSYLLYLGIYTNIRTRSWYNVDTIKREMRGLLKQRNEYHLKYEKIKDVR